MAEPTKTYLAVYLGTPAAMEAWRNKSEAERKALQAKGMAAWNAWAEKHKGAIVDRGAPLGKTKRVSAAGSPTFATPWPPIPWSAPPRMKRRRRFSPTTRTSRCFPANRST